MIEVIKKTLINVMVTTSAVLLLLPIVWVVYVIAKGADLPIWTVFISGGYPVRISTNTIYEIFIVNSLIHLGFLFTRKFESHYIVFEYLLDVSYTIIILVIFGIIFKWHHSTPVWLLALIGVLVYVFHVLMGIIRFNKDARDLNKLLIKRKQERQIL
jgi:hypothetical protein